MNRDSPDLGAARRPSLVTATTSGGAGLISTAVPLDSLMAASERARSLRAPVEVDVTVNEPVGTDGRPET